MTASYGPQFPPPRTDRGPVAVVWVALGLVLAVTIASFVVAHTGDAPPGATGPGGAFGSVAGSGGTGRSGGTTTSGPLSVGGHPYVNACNALPVATSNRTLGTLGVGYRVLETFAEKIRLAASETYADVESSCTRTPSDDDRAAVGEVSLNIDNYVKDTEAAQAVSRAEGTSLPGVSGAKLSTKDAYQEATLAVGNVAIRLEVQGARGKGPVPAGAVAASLKTIAAAAAKPSSAASTITTPYRSSRGTPLIACSLMTTQDYEQVTHYTAETARIERNYTVGPVDYPQLAGNECSRDSARTPIGEDLPPSPGTTYLKGGFGPTLEVTKYASAALANKDLADRYGDGQALPGLGQAAYFTNQAGAVQLTVRQGAVLLSFRAIGTVGTASWGRDKYVTLLSGLARIALSRV